MLNQFKSDNEEKKAKKSKAVELSHFLEGGLYDFDDDLRAIFKTSKRHSPIIEGLNFKNEVHNPFKIDNDKAKQFAGHIMWFCSNGDIKLFSDSETLTLCCNQDNYLRKINHYNYFSAFFSIPEIIDRDNRNNRLIENFIAFENKRDQDDDLILRTIYEDYTNYFTSLNRRSMVNYRTMDELLTTSLNTTHLNYSPLNF
ncbi:hypothetical protein ACS127_13900 [Amphibacillus sp. Q70]|uniref:hypothetical protein n=1 Tax=Amphibacillus sp. Q70 TaxID=3453416 RepID=UPI003F832C6D